MIGVPGCQWSAALGLSQQAGCNKIIIITADSSRALFCPHTTQVYKAVLRDSGEEVAVKVQRPGIEPVILRDLFIFRTLGSLFNTLSRQVRPRRRGGGCERGRGCGCERGGGLLGRGCVHT